MTDKANVPMRNQWLKIDSETAEVDWKLRAGPGPLWRLPERARGMSLCWTDVLCSKSRQQHLGRVFDLPKETREALWKRHQ